MSEVDPTKIYSQLGLTKPQETQKKNDQLGQAEFLELMTAQLQFQDPLKPMENGEFIGQMAQFGTVSGINDLNTAFSTVSASLQSNQALQASTLVGRSVMIPSTAVSLQAGEPVRGAVNLDRFATNVTVSIEDAAGQLMQRINLGNQEAGLVDFEWNGVDQAGNALPPGTYQISAQVERSGNVEAGQTLAVVDVESVTLGSGGQDLTLSVTGLGDIQMDQVRKILS